MREPFRRTLALVAIALLGACSSTQEATTTVSSLTVLVYGFNDEIRGGTVSLQDLAGGEIAKASGTLGEGGAFLVDEPLTLPRRLQVIASAIRTSPAPSSGETGDTSEPLPEQIRALVEAQGGDLLIRVTPLSALVARYAGRTGTTIADAKPAIRAYLKLHPDIDPCVLIPAGVEGDEDSSPFQFLAFRDAWLESGLGFVEFLDLHVDAARAGGTTDAFVGSSGAAFGKWVAKQVSKGIGSAAAGQGIGWLVRLVTGAPSMKEIASQLSSMERKLDQLAADLDAVRTDMQAVIAKMRAESRFDFMTRHVSTIDTRYERLQRLSKTTDLGAAKREAASIEDDWDDVNQAADVIAKLLDPAVGDSFYKLHADYLSTQVSGGQMTLAQAVAEQLRVYQYLVGVQAKALDLLVEHCHALYSNPVALEREVRYQLDRYVGRITLQSQGFLDAVERLAVLHANGDATLDYRPGGIFPATGDSKVYAAVDPAVGDAVAAESLLVSRLLWDSTAPLYYPGSDPVPSDYPGYFQFLAPRMALLEAADGSRKGTTLPVHLFSADGGLPVKAVDERGTVNVVTYPAKDSAGTAFTARVVVLRHVFRDFPVSATGIRYEVVPAAPDAARLDVNPAEVPVQGTVGPRAYGPPPIDGKSVEIAVLARTDAPYLTVPTYAWAPPYLLSRTDRASDAGRFLRVTLRRGGSGSMYAVRAGGATYGFLATGTTGYVASCDLPGQKVAHDLSVWPASTGEGKALSYGERFYLLGQDHRFLTFGGGRGAYDYLDTSYGRRTTTSYFILHPVPDLVRRFVSLERVKREVAPQLDVPVFVEDAYRTGKLMREYDYCGALAVDGTERDMPQRWTFQRVQP